MNRISFQDLPGASNTYYKEYLINAGGISTISYNYYNFHRPDSDVMHKRNSVYDRKAIQNSWKCFMTTYEMVVIL